MIYVRFIGIVVVILLILSFPCLPALEGEYRTILTRPGVTQSFLLIQSGNKPTASLILLAGAHRRLALSPQGMGWGEGNFLFRNRERFVQQGFFVAVADAPSDRPQGLWNFRASVAHAEEVQHVIAELKRISDIPVWLIGTSMGTVSAANAAARIKKGGPNGLVLTSTVTKEIRQVSGTGCRRRHCHYLVDQGGSWFQMSSYEGDLHGSCRARSRNTYLKKEHEA